MPYTLGQAAKAVGRAKSTLSRDIKSGKISASRNPDGGYMIDPAELHRVYPPPVRPNGAGNGRSNDPQPLARTASNGFEHREIELLREQLADRDGTIRHLRALVDREAEERRKLIAVLTDRRPWWRRLVR